MCPAFSSHLKVFLEDGIEKINTRIGIDFGDDEVLWANFGLMDVSELTTVNLHTSLASKMQGWASKNGIVLGQHIKDRLQIRTVTVLDRCTHKVKKITIKEAKGLGKDPCDFCYKGKAIPKAETMPISTQCKAITKAGTRCTRPVKSGSYCWQHS